MTTEAYFLGIDGGSQSTKVTLFDPSGQPVVSVKDVLPPLYTPGPATVEYPDDVLWDSLQAAMTKLMAKFTGDPSRILGIGLGSIRFCRAYLKQDGTLAYPVLSWMDERVSRPFDGKIPDVAYVTTATGYLSVRLTGEFTDTAANYQGVWPIDTDTWDWDSAKFAANNVTREMLFDLVQPGDLLGHLTATAATALHLPQGLPVMATANDKAVEGLGSGLAGTDTALVSLGTYITGMMAGANNRQDAHNFWTNFGCMPHQYLYESDGIRRGMWTVSWFTDVLGQSYKAAAQSNGRSPEAQLNLEAAAVPAGSEGIVTLLDFLAPVDHPFRKGAILGFDGRQGRAHIYRSILEAIAITMHDNVQRMTNELGTPLHQLVVCGGGAKSDLFMQIFADVFGIPAVRNRITDSAGLGAAICAAVGSGYYPDFGSAIAAMVSLDAAYQPNLTNTALYRRLAEDVYAPLRDHTDAIFQASSALID